MRLSEKVLVPAPNSTLLLPESSAMQYSECLVLKASNGHHPLPASERVNACQC